MLFAIAETSLDGLPHLIPALACRGTACRTLHTWWNAKRVGQALPLEFLHLRPRRWGGRGGSAAWFAERLCLSERPQRQYYFSPQRLRLGRVRQALPLQPRQPQFTVHHPPALNRVPARSTATPEPVPAPPNQVPPAPLAQRPRSQAGAGTTRAQPTELNSASCNQFGLPPAGNRCYQVRLEREGSRTGWSALPPPHLGYMRVAQAHAGSRQRRQRAHKG